MGENTNGQIEYNYEMILEKYPHMCFSDGNTVYHEIVRLNHIELVRELLLKSQFDLTVKNSLGKCPCDLSNTQEMKMLFWLTEFSIKLIDEKTNGKHTNVCTNTCAIVKNAIETNNDSLGRFINEQNRILMLECALIQIFIFVITIGLCYYITYSLCGLKTGLDGPFISDMFY